MLYYVHYLWVHAAGVRAEYFMDVNNVTLTRYLLYCQKAHTTTSLNEHFLPQKCNLIEMEM